MRYLRLFLLLLLPVLFINAQDSEKSSSGNGGILIIPFQPNMYFCSNDQFICQASGITPGELNLKLRGSMAATMLDNLTGNYSANVVSEKKESNQASDVERIYSIAKYSLEEKPLMAYYKKNAEPGLKNMFGLKSENNAPQYLNPAKPNLKKHRYYKAQFSDTAKLAQISKQYGVNYILFIDHFEMETHYKDCVEMHKNISQRDLYVHYTLLNTKGEFKDGGVVCTSYKSGSNEINEIMKNTLPSLASMIIEEIKPIIRN